MQKISRIVPGSPRVSGVDMKSASAVRPGTPSFGRPVGESTEIARGNLTTAQKAVNAREEMDARRKLGEQPEIVKNLTEQFFLQKASGPDTRSTVELINDGVEDGVEVPVQPMNRKEFVPPGSYLDVEA